MGPLTGVRIVEMSNIGPAPFCAMLLADLGADVLRVSRLATVDLGFEMEPRFDLLNRNKQAAAIDLKAPEGVETVKQLIATADMLIEGFRPGVMERLGLGPEVCAAINPRLVYGRMTGWGQQGSMSHLAGHDINYIAMTGALAAIGPKDGSPAVPLNLIGDFGGGSLYLAMGMLAALVEARQSGQGQVIDAAMVDGITSLMAMHLGLRQAGIWENKRGSNAVDGGSPYYTTYPTSDGKFIAVGAVERRFYRLLLDKLELDPAQLPDQNDKERWPELHAILASKFAARTRSEWAGIFADSDACVTPVLDMDECLSHPFTKERGLYEVHEGVTAPAPAPRFSRTQTSVRGPTVDPVAGTRDALLAWGIAPEAIESLREKRVIAG